MEISTALSMVHSLLERAEHESTPVAEAQACRDKADMMMRKYAFDAALARATKAFTERDKPDILYVDITRATFSTWLAQRIASFCRCQIRTYVYRRELGKSQHKVYGFKSDLQYFEILYTEVMLHMAGVLIPRWDPTLSDEENAYRLHKQGLNWLEMGELLGWQKNGVIWRGDKAQERWELRDKATGEVTEERTNWQLGSSFKRMFERACRAKGESPKDSRIAANGTENYRRSAADGYVTEYEHRLIATERTRDTSMALVLAGSDDDLLSFFKEDNPDLFVILQIQECPKCKAAASGHCREHPKGTAYKPRPLDATAYQRGVEHARTAPLGGARGMQDTKRAVEA